ncbi:MAG: aminopeptidase, partial [Desulfovibrio sp.]|nr:aminopeptidase [Desulfovibrio sp.]
MKNFFSYQPQSAWKKLNTSALREKVEALAGRYIDFLSACKTERETVEYVCSRLRQAKYGENFSGDRVFRGLRGKAVFAAQRGGAPLRNGLTLIAAHVDTPRLDFKQRPLVEQPCVVQAKTHYYGGIRKYQWLARPLALHGVIVREDGERIPVSIGERPEEPVFCIADLLPHLAQKQGNQKLSEVFEAEKLNIVLAHSPKTAGRDGKGKPSEKNEESVREHLLELLHAKYGICEEDMITAEMQAVPAGPARFVGFDRALVGGYGQDDRICVFAALEALLQAKKGTRNRAVIFWDKEEIGSEGATGAASRFFEYCVENLLPGTAPV